MNCEERDILKHVRRRSKAWVPRRLNLTGTTKQQSVEIIWFGVHRRIGDRHKCNGRIRPSPADLSQGHEVVGTRIHIAGILYLILVLVVLKRMQSAGTSDASHICACTDDVNRARFGL